MGKTFLNPFRFYGHHNERAKTAALFRCAKEGSMCATDMHGNPQAVFFVPKQLNRTVLGVPRSERVIEYKPKLMLEHHAK